MTKRVMILMTALGMLATGCELAVPLLVAELDGDDDSLGATTARLNVQVDSAEGMVRERVLAPEMLAVTGDRFGTQLQFAVQVGSPDTVMHVLVPQADGSSINPYNGRDPEGGEETPLPPELVGEGPGTPGLALQQQAEIMICDQNDCLVADDFDIQIEQTAEGRVATFEGTWADGQSARVVMRYTEEN